jgi:renalase
MSTADSYDRILVVGAGISGLSAARHLVDAGAGVTVFEKARGVGGRMSTRRLGRARMDHGAQSFTATAPAFRRLVDGWLEANCAKKWFGNPAEPGDEGRPTYRGLTGMNEIPKLLARGLDIRAACRVLKLTREDGGYTAVTEEGTVYRGRRVLLTAPVPESLALLDAGGIELPADSNELLRGIEYAPCFAVLAVLSGASAIPAPGGMKLTDGPISFIADNSIKGISSQPSALTIHATEEYSRSRIDADPDEVSRELLDAAKPWLGSEVEEVQVHRWLHSRPLTRTAEPFHVVQDSGPAMALVFAGDAFGGVGVEGATLSGLAAGEWLSRLG